MKRLHLIEFHDMGWVPTAWRDTLTDFMAFFAVRFNVYHPVLPQLELHIQRLRVSQIVDLCSGGAGPVRTLLRHIRTIDGRAINVILTDKYPNLAAFKKAKEEAGEGIDYLDSSIDATDVPQQLFGFRTLFASFHHFRPDHARSILQDASSKSQGIAVFEYTERNALVWAIPILLTPVFIWLCMPFVRPMTWRHLLWTYVLPIVPVIGAWDGFVSCLRTYSPVELRKLTENCGAPGYKWEIGRIRSFGACRVTYLFGYPSEAINAAPTSRSSGPGHGFGGPPRAGLRVPGPPHSCRPLIGGVSIDRILLRFRLSG